jgi:seryl-tRNA synthetase
VAQADGQAELGKANTSAGHQSASDRKARVALEAKVEKLEAKIQTMASSEKELRQELNSLLKSEKNTEDSVCHFSLAGDCADYLVRQGETTTAGRTQGCQV